MISNNTLNSPDNTASYEDGLACRIQDTAEAVVNVSGNRVTNAEDSGVSIAGSGSNQTTTSTIQNNNVAMSGGRGININNNVTTTVSGNTVSDSASTGMAVTGTVSNFSTTALLTGNTITSGGNDGMFVSDNNGTNSTINAAIRSNVITGVAQDSIDIQTRNRSCLVITGNTVDKDIEIETNNTACDLEQGDAATGGPLNTLNTLNNSAIIDLEMFSGGSFTFRPAGFCGL